MNGLFKGLSPLLLAVLSCVVVGCSREESPKSSKPSDAYFTDSEYRKQIDSRDAGRREIMKRFAEVRARYDAAKAKDPNGAETKSLEKRLSDLETAFEEHRRETERIVRERLMRDKANESK